MRPIQLPLTKTLVIAGLHKSSVVNYSNSWTPQSWSLWIMSVELLPTETRAIKVKFLTNPQADPSGVSAGQIMPQCELWSYLGLVSLPCLDKGVVRRRMCDSDEAKVSLLKTCDTPVLIALFCLSFCQFPVDKAPLRPLVIDSWRMALIRGKTFLFECKSFFIYLIISSINWRKRER